MSNETPAPDPRPSLLERAKKEASERPIATGALVLKVLIDGWPALVAVALASAGVFRPMLKLPPSTAALTIVMLAYSLWSLWVAYRCFRGTSAPFSFPKPGYAAACFTVAISGAMNITEFGKAPLPPALPGNEAARAIMVGTLLLAYVGYNASIFAVFSLVWNTVYNLSHIVPNLRTLIAAHNARVAAEPKAQQAKP